MHYIFSHPHLGELRLPQHLSTRHVKDEPLFVLPDGTTRTVQQLMNWAWSMGAPLGRVVYDQEPREEDVTEREAELAERERWGGTPASVGRVLFSRAERQNGIDRIYRRRKRQADGTLA